MKKFLWNWIIMSIVIYYIPNMVKEIKVDSEASAIMMALAIGLVNITIRKIFFIFSFPFIVLTFGLFIVFINAFIYYVVSIFIEGIHIQSFWGAIVASVIVSVASFVMGIFFNAFNKKD